MGQLTPHFNIDEFLFSQTATRKGIDNKPTPEVAENLRRLAEVLETVRLLLDGVPIRISSGYRSPALNDAIGGAPKSAHMQGLAADFTAPTFGTLKDTARRIAASGLAYDQLIFEHGTWLHLGIAESGHTPKKEDLSFFGANYRKTPLFTQI
ncbi:MAG: DUF882 domain-containing protein [Candidatus Accumulibacter sp.]|uniref:DUF882 domain-containing protein n=1 Tax=Candidatus Accumulibacter affinis TaxID=2954384 RepID=A0A935TAJ3_9PROT|nr:DUF882 domain-containing protein [Candidatus Accumulibacter affinis]